MESTPLARQQHEQHRGSSLAVSDQGFGVVGGRLWSLGQSTHNQNATTTCSVQCAGICHHNHDPSLPPVTPLLFGRGRVGGARVGRQAGCWHPELAAGTGVWHPCHGLVLGPSSVHPAHRAAPGQEVARPSAARSLGGLPSAKHSCWGVGRRAPQLLARRDGVPAACIEDLGAVGPLAGTGSLACSPAPLPYTAGADRREHRQCGLHAEHICCMKPGLAAAL